MERLKAHSLGLYVNTPVSCNCYHCQPRWGWLPWCQLPVRLYWCGPSHVGSGCFYVFYWRGSPLSSHLDQTVSAKCSEVWTSSGSHSKTPLPVSSAPTYSLCKSGSDINYCFHGEKLHCELNIIQIVVTKHSNRQLTNISGFLPWKSPTRKKSVPSIAVLTLVI